MPGRYFMRITPRFERAYDKEAAYSVEQYGAAHAGQYFLKIREHMRNLAGNPLAQPPRGRRGEYRISSVVEGIYILYHTHETKKIVTFMDIGGLNRLHEMRREAGHRKGRPRADLSAGE